MHHIDIKLGRYSIHGYLIVYSIFPLAICVYQHIKNVIMVTSLQDIKVTIKRLYFFISLLLYRKLRTEIYWLDILPCSQTTTV